MTRDTLEARQRRQRSGHSAELVAAAYLVGRGYRILRRRYKTHSGEIDLITLKRGRVGFVEVKRRATTDGCEAAITPRLRQRVRSAAQLWLAQHPQYQDSDCGFDLMFIRPWSWPEYRRDAL